jgi:hypothetical protein
MIIQLILACVMPVIFGNSQKSLKGAVHVPNEPAIRWELCYEKLSASSLDLVPETGRSKKTGTEENM